MPEGRGEAERTAPPNRWGALERDAHRSGEDEGPFRHHKDAATACSEAERILAGLDPEQQAAVTTTEGPVLVVAGPGSGKTRVLTHRVAYLIATGRARPEQILAVTFTNKAAREVKERLQGLLGTGPAELVGAGTFHSACVRVLRRHGGRLGLDPAFTIYDEDDQLALVKQALKELGLDPQRFAPRSLLSTISRAKNLLLPPSAFAQQAQSYWDEVAARVYERYAQLLQRAQAVDFDDLLLLVVELFDQHPDVLARYQEHWRYLLVDEYQDTNHLQYLLVRALAAGHRNLCAVGDPDQSIYSWRQADIRNILEFQRDFPDAVVIRLGRNYRSTPQIVAAADAVIRANRLRIERRLWTENPPGPPIRLFACWDEQHEAETVATEIARLVTRGEARYQDIAVLYRINAQSRPLEEALVRRQIPYQVVGGVRFYERKEVKDALALLRVLVNPHDWISLRRVLSETTLGQKIGEKTLQQLEHWGLRHGRSPADALLALVGELDREPPELAAQTSKRLREVWGELVRLRGALVDRPLSAVYDLALERSGLAQRYREASDPNERERWENLVQLRAVLERYDELPAREGLQLFLEEAALVTSVDEQQAGDHVSLMTLHTAKGLEFPVVFLIGVEEGMLPHARSLESQAELEEERRLFYVGITRAKERLYLSYAQLRSRFGLRERNLPSHFLEALPPEVIEEVRGTGSLDRGRGTTGETRTERSVRVPTPPRAQTRFVPGQRVFHPIFGDGVVLAVKDQAGDQEVTVQFKRHGNKILLASLAKLVTDG
ncbi:UvrD-helicase domain-containing protein [Thermomicrobium sp. CFH 73360]|uniref:ATP-dependent helicase n=1 Tax=Thermomicrobium sp. CFH 73360 TaxID=2951987 RepID=UPI002076B3B5|nr:UvrD-helicase domain-containing protein [Thermomicrobium sp. CFH 73360]MCM8745685.1 UvrD-helicase domain-containing protein [Thermomicrobium sp. CFH 73360]